MYKIVYGYTAKGRERVRKFATLDEAIAVASEIFSATGVVVGITSTGGRIN